jgi:hypothetical protein
MFLIDNLMKYLNFKHTLSPCYEIQKYNPQLFDNPTGDDVAYSESSNYLRGEESLLRVDSCRED